MVQTVCGMPVLYGVCSKESEEYEQSIIDDLGKLGIVGTWLYILPLCWYEPVFRVLEHIWRVCGEI